MFLGMMRNIGINTSNCLLISALLFMAGENYSRYYPPDSVRMTKEAASYFGFLEYEEEIGGWILKKNYDGWVFFRFGKDFHMLMNFFGLRNSEIDRENGDQFRVLVAGDSFTMGYGVHQKKSFPARMSEFCKKISQFKGN